MWRFIHSLRSLMWVFLGFFRLKRAMRDDERDSYRHEKEKAERRRGDWEEIE